MTCMKQAQWNEARHLGRAFRSDADEGRLHFPALLRDCVHETWFAEHRPCFASAHTHIELSKEGVRRDHHGLESAFSSLELAKFPDFELDCVERESPDALGLMGDLLSKDFVAATTTSPCIDDRIAKFTIFDELSSQPILSIRQPEDRRLGINTIFSQSSCKPFDRTEEVSYANLFWHHELWPVVVWAEGGGNHNYRVNLLILELRRKMRVYHLPNLIYRGDFQPRMAQTPGRVSPVRNGTAAAYRLGLPPNCRSTRTTTLSATFSCFSDERSFSIFCARALVSHLCQWTKIPSLPSEDNSASAKEGRKAVRIVPASGPKSIISSHQFHNRGPQSSISDSRITSEASRASLSLPQTHWRVCVLKRYSVRWGLALS